MYRRIEMIHHYIQENDENTRVQHYKGGIFTLWQPEEVLETWVKMPTPRKPIPKNCRYYFTEKGWDLYGRKIVKACQRTGQEYRVLKVKENAVEPLYKDDVQVVVRPLKKRP